MQVKIWSTCDESPSGLSLRSMFRTSFRLHRETPRVPRAMDRCRDEIEQKGF